MDGKDDEEVEWAYVEDWTIPREIDEVRDLEIMDDDLAKWGFQDEMCGVGIWLVHELSRKVSAIFPSAVGVLSCALAVYDMQDLYPVALRKSPLSYLLDFSYDLLEERQEIQNKSSHQEINVLGEQLNS